MISETGQVHRRGVGAALWLGLIIAALPMNAASPTGAAVAGVQTRCGWYSNPTPANHYLFDRDGRWVIGEQGSGPALGFGLNVRRLNTAPTYWVGRNVGSYGYGCLCLGVDVEPGRMRISRIHSSRQRPLAACRADRRIPPFESAAARGR